MRLNFKKLLTADWEIVAGLAAAVGVIVLKFLHLVHAETMLTLAIVMLAGLFLRELRRETVVDKFIEDIAEIQASVKQLSLHQADQGSLLITPAAMNDAMRLFSRRASGTCVFKYVSPFEAPASKQVPKEMRAYIQWFNDTAPGRKQEIDKPPVRSALTHCSGQVIPDTLLRSFS
jgi:hypothetical protein